MALAERKRRDQSAQFAIAAQNLVEPVCDALARTDNTSARVRQTATLGQLHDFTRQQDIIQAHGRRSKQRRHILRARGRTRGRIYYQRGRLQQLEIATRDAEHSVSFTKNGRESEYNALTLIASFSRVVWAKEMREQLLRLFG